MSYRLLKLVSDYVSGGVYTNRLELGDSGLGGPVDIRFIDEPGWLENVHSIFFSVNGTDTYPSSGGKGKITTTKYTNELVFFDELNTSGRTLSQLYEGAAGELWQDTGNYVQLLQADSVSLRSQYITNLHDPQYSTDAATKNYVDTGFAANPLTSDLDAGGHDIKNLSQLFGKVESGFSWDLIFWGSNVGGSAAVEMMRWDASAQNINVNGRPIKEVYKLRASDISGVCIHDQLYDIVRIKLGAPEMAFIAYANANMNNNKITDLAAGTPGSSDAARMSDVGGGTGLWQVDGTETQLITAQDIDLRSKGIYFDKGDSNTRIYPSGDNIIINPTSTTSSIGLGGILSADYGIINCDGITMYDSDSVLDMNYGSIVDSDDITLYDGGSLSPKLSLKVPFIESAGGVEFSATDNMLYCSKISGGILAQCTMDTGEWYFLGAMKTLGDINVNNNDLINVDKIKAYFSTGIDIVDSAGSDKITLATTSYALVALANLDINGKDIINVDEIKGTLTNSLELDFRGDANQKIYYDSANTRIAYKAAVEHAFAVGANITTTISANGILMNSGKYIKSLTGDLELRAPSGSKIKFVIG